MNGAVRLYSEKIIKIARQGIKVVVALSIVATFIINVIPMGEFYIIEKILYPNGFSATSSDVSSTASTSDSVPEKPATSVITTSLTSESAFVEEDFPQTSVTESHPVSESSTVSSAESTSTAAVEVKSEHVTSSVSAASGLININTATSEQLKTLSGIGDVKAQAIIDYRTEHGGFNSIDELLNVKGIGEKTLEKIRPGVTV